MPLDMSSLKLVFESNPKFYGELNSARKKIVTEQAKTVSREAKRLVPRKKAYASQPGSLPLGKTGNYRRSIKYKVARSGLIAFVGPTRPKGSHANLLKYGTKRMASRSVPSEKALDNVRPKLAEIARNKL